MIMNHLAQLWSHAWLGVLGIFNCRLTETMVITCRVIPDLNLHFPFPHICLENVSVWLAFRIHLSRIRSDPPAFPSFISVFMLMH